MSALAFDVEIARSAEDVFAALLDPDFAPEWTSGLLSRRLVTPPPVSVGSRWEDTHRVAGTTHTLAIEVTVHDAPRPGASPPWRHGGRGEALGVEAGFLFTVEALDAARCRVRLTATIEGRTLLGRPLASRLRRAAQDEGRAPLLRLRDALERAKDRP